MKKRILSMLLAMAMVFNTVLTVGMVAFAEAEPQREFPYGDYECPFAGKTPEELDAILRQYGHTNGLKTDPVEGKDYCTASDCVWEWVESTSQACKWQCTTHYAETEREQIVNGEQWQHVWFSVGIGHSGHYCPHCKWTDHDHVWDTENWAGDNAHHWHECTEDCYVTDNSQKNGYGAHQDENKDGVCDVCGGHVHAWSEDWAFGETDHWHNCVGSCPVTEDSEKDSYNTHTWGGTDHKCTVCDAAHTPQMQWRYDDDQHWEECTVEDCSTATEKTAHSYDTTTHKCDCGKYDPELSTTYVKRSWNEGTKTVESENKFVTGAIPVSANTTFEDGKWYVVDSNVTIGDRTKVNGTANLILADGFKLTLSTGIDVTENATLNIYGQTNDSGKLEASTTHTKRSAIGGNENNNTAGTVTIHGGNITASTSYYGAGIGGGYKGSGGITTIYGGTVNAKSKSGAGIGGGYQGSCGIITIYGGTVNASASSTSKDASGAGIGCGSEGSDGNITIYGGTVTANAQKGAGIGSGAFKYNGTGVTFAIYGGTVTAQTTAGGDAIGGGSNTSVSATVTLGDGVGLRYGANDTSAASWVKSGDANIGTALKGAHFAKTGTPPADTVAYAYVERSWDEATKTVKETPDTAENCVEVTSNTATFEDGKWYVVTEAVTVSNRIEVEGTAHLILADGAKLTAEDGIQLNNGGKLYIHGQAGDSGQLIANTKSDKNPAIGSNAGESTPLNVAVIIEGGTITATGNLESPAIGSGSSGGHCDVTINGGRVAATGIRWGAGIGAGPYGAEADITINGGVVNAIGGDRGGAAIGSSSEGGKSSVIINGGDVTATVTSGDTGLSAAIGSGSLARQGCDVVINGGVVAATGAKGPGIGHGYETENTGSVTITGGTVTATGGTLSAGIGGPKVEKDKYRGKVNVTITGGIITATGGDKGAGIGGGGGNGSFENGDSGGTIKIEGGTIKASGGSGAAGIGGGAGGSFGSQGAAAEVTLGTGVALCYGSDETSANEWVKHGDTNIGATLNGHGFAKTGTPPSTHQFTFQIPGDAKNTLVATCGEETCSLPDGKLTLTLTAEGGQYNGTVYTASHNDEDVKFSEITESQIGAVVYYSGATQMLNAPTNPGTYKAKLTVTAKSGTKYTLEKEFTISKATMEPSKVTAPSTKVNLVYSGSAQQLINAGKVSGGTLHYSADYDPVTKQGTWVTAVSDITGTNAGSYTVYYKVVGDAFHADTEPATVTASIAKKPITVSVIKAENKTYDGTTDAALNYNDAVFTGIVSGEELAVTATGAFVNADVGTGKDVNITNITLTDSEGKDYAKNYELTATGNQSTAKANITKKDITVTITSNGGTYAGTITAASAVLHDLVEGDTTTKATLTYTNQQGTASYNSTTTPTNAGAYTVTATVSNTNYNLTGTTTAEFKIAKAAANLSVDLTFSKTYGDADFSLGATKDSDATATYAVTDGDAVTVDTTGKVTIAKAGTATITVSVAENSNYLADSKDVTVTVAKKQGTLTITNVTYNVTYGDADFTIGTITSEGDTNSPITFTDFDNKVATVDDDGKVTIVGAGETTVKVNRANGSNYLAAVEVPVTVKVAKKAVTVTAEDKEAIFADEDTQLTYTNTALIGEDTLDVILEREPGADVGEYVITASQAEGANPNYELTFEDATYTIKPRPLTEEKTEIVLDNALIANGVTQTQKIKSVTLTVGEGKDAKVLDVTYKVSGNTGKDAGAYTLTVTGNGNFEGTAEKSFVILPAPASKPATNSKGAVVVGDGTIEVEAKGVTLNTDKATVIAAVPEEVLTAQILSDIADGDNVDIVLEVEPFDPNAADKALVAKKLGAYTVGQYLDVDLTMILNNTIKTPITKLNEPISVSVELPDSLIQTNVDVKRTYAVIRVHDGEVDVLDASFNASTKMLTFKTDRFSTYSVVYKDTTTPKTGDTRTTIMWGGMMLVGLMAITAGAMLPGKKRYHGKYSK